MADRFYRCSLNYVVGGQAMTNVLHFKGDDAALDFSPLTAQGLADHVGGSGVVTAWRSFIPTGDLFTDVVVREMLAPGSTAVPDEGAHTVAAAGTRTGVDGEMPLQACGLLKLHTAAAIRSGHGHLFMPPIFDSGELGGQRILHTSEYWTALGSAVTELGHMNRGGSSWSGGTWGLCVYSRTRRARLLADFAFHVTSESFGDEVHWLRSRSAYQVAPDWRVELPALLAAVGAIAQALDVLIRELRRLAEDVLELDELPDEPKPDGNVRSTWHVPESGDHGTTRPPPGPHEPGG